MLVYTHMWAACLEQECHDKLNPETEEVYSVTSNKHLRLFGWKSGIFTSACHESQHTTSKWASWWCWASLLLAYTQLWMHCLHLTLTHGLLTFSCTGDCSDSTQQEQKLPWLTSGLEILVRFDLISQASEYLSRLPSWLGIPQFLFLHKINTLKKVRLLNKWGY